MGSGSLLKYYKKLMAKLKNIRLLFGNRSVKKLDKSYIAVVWRPLTFKLGDFAPGFGDFRPGFGDFGVEFAGPGLGDFRVGLGDFLALGLGEEQGEALGDILGEPAVLLELEVMLRVVGGWGEELPA